MKPNRSRPIRIAPALLAFAAVALTCPQAFGQNGRLRHLQNGPGRINSGRPLELRIAVFTVMNEAGPDREATARDVNEALLEMLEGNPYFDVVRVTAGATGSLRERLSIAANAGADVALVARVTRVGTETVRKNGNGPTRDIVEVMSELWNTDTETLFGRTYALARSDRIPTRVNGTILAGSAPQQMVLVAADETADQLTQIVLMRGIVIGKPEAGHIRISLGSLSELRNRAEVQFGHDEDIIGFGDVIEVDDAQALVRVRPGHALQRIELNTPVLVVYNPPAYAAGPTVKQLARREELRDDIEFGVALVTAVLSIFVFKPIFER